MKKGQQEVLSVVLISGILIGVVGSVYFWGVPLIQKNKDVAIMENSEAFVRNLNNKIKFVANNGGRDSVKIPAIGIVRFDGVNGILEATVNTDGTIYSTGAEIPIGRNTECGSATGIFGVNDPETICVKSMKISDKSFRTIYTLKYVKLVNNEALQDFEIKLRGTGRSGGEDNTIIIENKGTTESTTDGRTVVSTLIDISII